MDKERQISAGKSAIKDLLASVGKKGRRYHRSAAEEDLQRLRALEGICGDCENVRVEVFLKNGKRVANVNCKAGHSPVNLYYNTQIGEEADCPDFTPRE